MTKIAGSGSICQRHGSADPDPHQNVMDPEHCQKPKMGAISKGVANTLQPAKRIYKRKLTSVWIVFSEKAREVQPSLSLRLRSL
jgi:hypothetical protein